MTGRNPRRRYKGSCEWCARATGRRFTTRVAVEPLRDGIPDVGDLFLCEPCATMPDRTWRRRWSPVDPALAV